MISLKEKCEQCKVRHNISSLIIGQKEMRLCPDCKDTMLSKMAELISALDLSDKEFNKVFDA